MPHVDVITSVRHLSDLASQWRQLYEQANCRLPFLHLTWIQNWWDAFGRSKPFVRNELMILAVKDHHRLVGIMPFYRATYGLGPMAGFRYIRPLGSDPNITEIQAALVLPGQEATTFHTVGRYFAERPNTWDFLNWNSVPVALEPATDLPGRILSPHRRPPVEMFVLHLPKTWDDFAAPLTRNTKEAVRKAHNALKRDGLEPEFQVLESPGDILALLPRFFDLHGRRASLNDAIEHPDVFHLKLHREFLIKIVQTMGAEGMVRLFILRVRGEIVALRLGFVIKDDLYFYYSGFDPAYGKYSVMTRLVVETIKWAIRNGITTINLSSGRDRSKLRWNPDILSYQNYSHLGQRWRSRAAFAAINKVWHAGPTFLGWRQHSSSVDV